MATQPLHLRVETAAARLSRDAARLSQGAERLVDRDAPRWVEIASGRGAMPAGPYLVGAGRTERTLRPNTSTSRAWLRLIRVKQWPKNLLVLCAPAAADALARPGVLVHLVIAVVAFCLLSSAVYLLNDVCDAAEDRTHPVKRHRPIASGVIKPQAALGVAGAGGVAALLLSLVVSPTLAAVAAGYAGLNIAYTTWLRRVAVADIGAIAASFVLRALAGGVAAPVPVSHWFILVVSFAALFVAAGKRYADIVDPVGHRSRAVLEQYNPDFLRLTGAAACAATLLAYSLWAFGGGHTDVALARELTLVPFALGLLRYSLLVSEGAGGAPETVILSDRFLHVAGVAWLLLFAVGA